LVTAKEIPPGGVGEVKATFRSKGYQGQVKKTFTVETNDPDSQGVRLVLSGKVVSEVTVTPRYVNFGNVSREKLPPPKELEITFREGKDIELKEVRSESDSIVLTELKKRENGVVYRVSLAERLPVGRLTGRISVRTDSKKSPEIKVPFYAMVQGNVKITPQVISFGMVRPGKTSTRQLTLRKTGAVDFSVKRIKTTTDAVTTEVEEEKPGESYRVHVTYDPGERTEGRISERLSVFLEPDGKEEEEILEVPIYGTIRKGVKNNP
jgi:hypothetical protein